MRENTHHGQLQSTQRVLESTSHRIWALVGSFWVGMGAKKVGFALDWVLSETGDDSVIRQEVTTYLAREVEA